MTKLFETLDKIQEIALVFLNYTGYLLYAVHMYMAMFIAFNIPYNYKLTTLNDKLICCFYVLIIIIVSYLQLKAIQFFIRTIKTRKTE